MLALQVEDEPLCWPSLFIHKWIFYYIKKLMENEIEMFILMQNICDMRALFLCEDSSLYLSGQGVIPCQTWTWGDPKEFPCGRWEKQQKRRQDRADWGRQQSWARCQCVCDCAYLEVRGENRDCKRQFSVWFPLVFSKCNLHPLKPTPSSAQLSGFWQLHKIVQWSPCSDSRMFSSPHQAPSSGAVPQCTTGWG